MFRLVILCLSLICFAYFLFTYFTLFPDVPFKVAEIDISGEGQTYPSLLVYKSLSNAVTNESIQLRVLLDGKEEVVAVYERYDGLKEYYFNQSVLYMILIDSLGYRHSIDTFEFDLGDIPDLIGKY